MSKRFTVEDGCRRLPNSNKIVCDRLRQPSSQNQDLKDSKRKKPTGGGGGSKKKKKKDNDEDNKVRRRYVPTITAGKRGRATRKMLTEDEVLQARGIQGSKIFEKKGMNALKKHLEEYLPGYKVEKAINEGILVSKDGRGRLFFRGSNLRKLSDLLTDFKIYSGKISDTKHYKNLKNLADEAVQRFGKENVTVAGHSLGGAMSYKVGQELDLPSLSLNPLIAPKVVSTLNPQNVATNVAREFINKGPGIDARGFRIDAKHQILRTVDDPVSSLVAFSKLPSSARLDTFEGDLTRMNIVKWHFLDNFYKRMHQNTNFGKKSTADLEAALKKQSVFSKKIMEYIALNDMKESVDKGQTFKEFLSEFSPFEVNKLGKFGPRSVDNMYDLWKKSGGKVSNLEAAELRKKGTVVRKKNINPDLDSKTTAFETKYTRRVFLNDIKKNASMMRFRKVKNNMTSNENEKRMLETVKNSKDSDLKTLRKQYQKRVQEVELKPKNVKRQLPNPDEIRRDIQRRKLEVQRVRAKLRREKANKRLAKVKAKQQKREEKIAAVKSKRDELREQLRSKYKGRLKPGLSEEAENRQIRMLQRKDARSRKRRLDTEEDTRYKNRQDELEETKDEEPELTVKPVSEKEDEFNFGQAPFQRPSQPRQVEQRETVLTRDQEAQKFLQKSKVERQKEIDNFKKKLDGEMMSNEAAVNESTAPTFKDSVRDNFIGSVKGLPASIVASYGTNKLFKALDPDGKFTQSLGGQAASGATTGLLTGALLRGVGQTVSSGDLGELTLASAVGQAASAPVTQAVYTGLRQDGLSNRASSGIANAAGGSTFAAAAGGTVMATRAATSAVRQALSGGGEAAEKGVEGVEMTETAETAEGAGEAAEGAGEAAEIGTAAAEGAEIGAEAGEVAGPFGLVAGIIAGGLIGGIIGLLDPPSPTNKNQETYQQRLDDWENKTGIFSDDTIVAQKDNKKTLTMNNFTINKDQLALNSGENPTLKPIIDKV